MASSLLVVGTLALDTVETPERKVADVLGGSASYFSMAASLLGPVRLVGVVGEDFPERHRALLGSRPIDLSGLSTTPKGKTFRWSGRYHADMNTRDTLDTQLNVIAGFRPTLPDDFRDSRFLYLANDSPATQIRTLEQVRSPHFVMLDTMNYWIENEREPLFDVLKRVDGVIINDEEARLLTGSKNLISAGTKVLGLGPRVVIVKKGEHGAFLFSHFVRHALPAFPIENVVDPTGAGDSFAGGFMGYLARRGTVTLANLKRAMAYGTVLASFCVEAVSLGRLASLTRDEVEGRLDEFVQFMSP